MIGLEKWLDEFTNTYDNVPTKPTKPVLKVLKAPGIEVSEKEMREAAGANWPEIAGNPERLQWWARTVSLRKIKRRGEVPEGWRYVATCKYCGPVWIFHPADGPLDLCPWCWNRHYDWPIPRPAGVSQAHGSLLTSWTNRSIQ